MWRLSLAKNFISSIELRVFDESANLSSLSSINLLGNLLTELEPWPFIRAQHRPMFVGLRENRISKFTNALQWKFDCNSTRVYKTHVDFHTNKLKHITDVINSWNIDGLLLYHIIIVCWCVWGVCSLTCIVLWPNISKRLEIEARFQ